MKITFLGTAAMAPTKERNAQAILISFQDDYFLIDCGEGTQRQLRTLGISPSKISKIFISHWHADHILGIPGLLHTVFSADANKKVEIFGPKNSKRYLTFLLGGFNHEAKSNIQIYEIDKEGLFLKNNYFEFYAKKLYHGIPCLGYKIKHIDKRKINLNYTKKFGLTQDPILKHLQQGKTITFKGKKITPDKGTILQKGKSVTIISDTGYSKEISKFAKDTDLLISEATLSSELQEKALEFKHLTSADAAKIAKDAKAKELCLTHFSQRHKDASILVKEAKKIFKKTKAASDFEVIDLE